MRMHSSLQTLIRTLQRGAMFTAMKSAIDWD
jgi:hypothetical protein